MALQELVAQLNRGPRYCFRVLHQHPEKRSNRCSMVATRGFSEMSGERRRIRKPMNKIEQPEPTPGIGVQITQSERLARVHVFSSAMHMIGETDLAGRKEQNIPTRRRTLGHALFGRAVGERIYDRTNFLGIRLSLFIKA
jgi:hypothetical protein